MKQGIQDAGFVNIHEQVWKVPLGTWAADPKQRELGYVSIFITPVTSYLRKSRSFAAYP